MKSHSFFGKQKLCYTNVADFTNYQGIGNDPMYRRFDSVYSIVKQTIPESYQHFLATPEYISEEDLIYWHIAKWEEQPTRLTELSGVKQAHYKGIFDETLEIYKSSLNKLSGEELHIMSDALKFIDEEKVYCADEKVYLVAWGMTLDTRQHKVMGAIIHEDKMVKKYNITFHEGEHGTISKIDNVYKLPLGTTISASLLPPVTTEEGWELAGWQPNPVGVIVDSDMEFTAQYTPIAIVVEDPQTITGEETNNITQEASPQPEAQEQKFFNCRFDAGKEGTIKGQSNIQKLANSKLQSQEIPTVTPHKGYKFVGWNISPLNCLVDKDIVFTAKYEQDVPWYKRGWLWLTGHGCLKWLLWILLFLLIILLLFWLLKGCDRRKDVNGVKPIETIIGDDGKARDDNGRTVPITGEDGKLPDNENGQIVAPIVGDDGNTAPIIEQPGMPSIIANRLMLFMESDQGDLQALAQDFKRTYPGEQYQIVGFDEKVKLLVIQVPENERDQIRNTINSKIPHHQFFVLDEEFYEQQGEYQPLSAAQGWHLDAINLRAGWAITEGSPDIKIAIVDDGIDAHHAMFQSRIVGAYNVFKQDNRLSTGEGHGTHVAALAAGSTAFYGEGAAGVAPRCMIMPIQVSDNGMIPLSAIVSGIMYAVHHGADVVNISLGPPFPGLDVLPREEQNAIGQTQLKNAERLWNKVCSLAAAKQCILVFAAGNDHILSNIPPNNRSTSSIVVTAVDNSLTQTKFTNYGPCSDISAPGKDIYSAFPPSQFTNMSGTSMAAPIVTGTIALMKSLKKDLTVTQARNVLYRTGAPVYGDIPPMVLVDQALAAVQRGEFSAPPMRERQPIADAPGGDNGSGSGVGDGYTAPRVGSGGGGSGDGYTSPGSGSGDGGYVGPGHGGDSGSGDGYTYPGSGNGSGDGSYSNPYQPPKTDPVPPRKGDNETDYDAIRRLIQEYKRKIEELERLLPNHN